MLDARGETHIVFLNRDDSVRWAATRHLKICCFSLPPSPGVFDF